MELQAIINVAGGAALAAIGWFARQLWEAVGELRRDIHSLEVELPKNYIRRDEFTEGMNELKRMLEKIFDRLEGKADK